MALKPKSLTKRQYHRQILKY